jgi:hypothetical protein
MDEHRLPLYPIYQDGGLDALFALVAPEQRWQLVESATISARKPPDADQPLVPQLLIKSVCRL